MKQNVSENKYKSSFQFYYMLHFESYTLKKPLNLHSTGTVILVLLKTMKYKGNGSLLLYLRSILESSDSFLLDHITNQQCLANVEKIAKRIPSK